MVVGLLALLGASATPAHAGSRAGGERAPKILSPAPFSIVDGKRLLVAVRVPKVRGTVFRASIGARDVTSRFGPKRRGVRTARIGGLTPGKDALTVSLQSKPRKRVRTARLVDAATIYVRAPKERTLLSVGHVRLGRGHVPVSRRHPFRQVSGNPRAIRLVRAWVNGRPEPGVMGSWEHAGRPANFRISSSFGIRPGRNVVRIEAVRDDGTYDRRRRVIELPRNRPVAGAGRDRKSVRGQTIRLDGRDSMRARAGAGRLQYRWRVVSKPKGAKPRLLGASTARPRLKTSALGRYRVALTVRQRIGGQMVGSANRDAVSVATAPVTTAAGIPFETMAFDSSSGNLTVQVGDGLYDYPTQGTPPTVLGYTVMTFDAETLEQTAEYTPAYNVAGPCQPNETACQSAFADGIPSGSQLVDIDVSEFGPSGLVYYAAAQAAANGKPQIVVVIGQAIEDWVNANPNGLAQLEVIGGPSEPLGMPSGNTPFSFVGVTNATAGTGWWNATNGSLQGPSVPGGQDLGNITGNLAPGSGGLFTYVPQDAVAFDTNTTAASTGATTVTATIGEQEVTGTCSGSNGLLAASIDAGTAQVEDQQVWCGGDVNAYGAGWLDTHGGPGTLVMLQSIGTLTNGQPEVGQAMGLLAGNEGVDALNAVDGGFSFLGGVGTDDELYWSNQVPGGPIVGTRLQGLLVRGNDGQLTPQLSQRVPDLTAASVTPGNDDEYIASLGLQLAAYAPPVPWPGTEAEQAAVQYISEELGFKELPDPYYGGADTYDVRTHYDTNNYENDFNTSLSSTGFQCRNGLLDSGPLAGTTFTTDECDDALAQLKLEASYVGEIQDLTDAMLQQFAVSEGSQTLLFSAVSETVTDQIVQDDVTVAYDWPDFVGAGLDALDVFVGDVPFVGSLVGLLAAGVYTADQFVTDGNGVPLTQVSSTFSALAGDIDSTFTTAIDSFYTLEDVLISDWGKLQTVGAAASTAQPGFSVPQDAPTQSAAQTALTTAVKRILIPPAIATFAPNAYPLPQYGAFQAFFQTYVYPTFLGPGRPSGVVFDCGDGDVLTNVNPNTTWAQQVNLYVDTGQYGNSPSYVVWVLGDQWPVQTLVPSSVTNGIYDPPDGNAGTLAAGFTPASLFASGAFSLQPPIQPDICGAPYLPAMPGDPPFTPPQPPG